MNTLDIETHEKETKQKKKIILKYHCFRNDDIKNNLITL